MFVVIDPPKNKTYGSFATFEEARIWGEDHMYHAPFISGKWYVNQVDQVQGSCAMKPYNNGLAEVSEDDGDCC